MAIGKSKAVVRIFKSFASIIILAVKAFYDKLVGMKVFFTLLIIIALLPFASAGSASAQSVVLENFSATDCLDAHDNEPTIEKILNENEDVLVLSCHTRITDDESLFYKKECSDRKLSYLSRYYLSTYSTPTIVINGRYNTKGQYPHIITSGVSMARAEDKLLSIPVQINEGIFSAALPEMKNGIPYELWFFAYDNEEIISVPQPDEDTDDFSNPLGIPETKDVRFVNVVKEIHRLSDWDGKPESIAIPLKNITTNGYALIAQEAGNGSIHAAGYINNGN